MGSFPFKVARRWKGFRRKQGDVLKLEAEAKRRALLDRLAHEAQQVTEHGMKFRPAAERVFQLASEGEAVLHQYGRTVEELEGLGERRLQPASALLRESIGDRPPPSTAMNFSEYGKEVFLLLSQILALNPANLMRARLSRRQNGRFGESFQARDRATGALVGQVKNARAAS
jgi:hypothetical protein